MGLIKKIIAKHKERVKVRNEACDNLIAQVDTAIQEINLLFQILNLLLIQAKKLNGATTMPL